MKDRVAELRLTVAINKDVMVDRLKDIKAGMEDYRRHKNMTWLKHKVQQLIDDLEGFKR